MHTMLKRFTSRRATRALVAVLAHNNTGKSNQVFPSVTVAAALVSIAALSLSLSLSLSAEDIAGPLCLPLAACDPEYFSVAELGRTLREKLQPGRERLRRQGRAVPSITVRSVHFPDRQGRETETQVLDMSFSPSEAHSLSALVSHWLDAMEDSPSPSTPSLSPSAPSSTAAQAKTEHLKAFLAFCADKQQLTLPVVSRSRGGSMTITKFAAADAPSAVRLSVSVFKDHGFSPANVESIVRGYTEAFNVAGHNKVPRESIEVLMETDKASSENDLRSIFERHFRTPSEEPRTAPSGGGADSAAAALEGLRSLGVEIFDKESNERLGWEDLAGYEHIKREIEDTVIHALQFPEVYEEIAQQTRVRYESNRPKALLLEGPPGTGKTLTARILASQVEAPLVVLKLESIVSKWYGDSEKKLSKILDHCEALPDAIIFADEIDALTQSRDSESGVHEVSKRILSVLLQRLEGFHGKSKSLLICTTNRQQDLDKALLSRFDLIIPYDLPDQHTRVEIFKRYAKHFANLSADEKKEDPYTVLGRVSEGLSCRDLKEACEQAERKCASRLVKHKMAKSEDANKAGSGGGSWIRSVIPGSGANKTEAPSSLPTLDDYLDSLRGKNMERHSQRRCQRPEPFSSV